MATGTTVFSRVTVLAPRTRIDVALPADVPVADLMSMLLEMAKEATPDGGARHGGWCLAKMGDVPLDPSRTLGSLGIVDGDMLQLRKRAENPPPPLYDDVVDAIAESAPDSYRPWTKDTARRIGHIAGALALVLGAAAVWMGGPMWGGGNLGPAITAGVAAVVFVALGAVIARGYQEKTTGVLIAAAGALPMAFVSGLAIVPGATGRASLLLASALVLIVASASIMLIGAGVTTFVAAGTAAGLGVLAFGVATLIAHPAAGIAAGAVAVALAALSLLPRLTIQLARLPLPNVPGSAEDLKEDTGFPDYRSIERRAGLAHEYMTGMIVGCGVVTAIGAIVTASAPGPWGVILGVVATLVLLLRGRTYANGSQAIALLATGMLGATGILIGWMMAMPPFERLLWVFGALVVVAAGALVLGVVFPRQRFSPPLRRSVEVFEAICIAVVLPLALAVMNLYAVLRHVDFNI
ncbi:MULTISPECIES: type VII secretion integral membrane protein EccD [Actinokineospora]|uniref:Type VII secretion integral membrane protein EccD n=1 Tax=Actinokineospora fastidiosa TaxID=1816 RepID=A0A918G8S7_9PSEU|nr:MULTISPECIES: type VII secretion integral membrane protein EccD [Actinokineospora]UVS82130.1 Type VII secretion system protein eccD1 [Actinokineospora sp. UTMC 2448]GGS23362.1 type VII secretion integral membrane protein EccD [Actinokineospora fastidiosa]